MPSLVKYSTALVRMLSPGSALVAPLSIAYWTKRVP